MESVLESSANVMAEPTALLGADGRSGHLKVDYLARFDEFCVVGGWQSTPVVSGVSHRGEPVPLMHFSQFYRGDVNQHLETSPQVTHGFGLVFPWESGGGYCLAAGGRSFPLDLDMAINPLGEPDVGVVGEALLDFLHARNLIRRKSGTGEGQAIKCALDQVLRWPGREGDDFILASGWAVAPADVRLLVGDGVNFYSPQIHTFMRPDIARDYDICPHGEGYGFIFAFKGIFDQWTDLNLYAEHRGSKYHIATAEVTDFHSYRAFLEAVFKIQLPTLEINRIYRDLYIPYLSEIQRARVKAIETGQKSAFTVGKPSCQPTVSVVVPLYGTLASLETQAQRCAWDADFDQYGEIIYVIADADMVEPFTRAVRKLASEYAFSCRCILGGTSMGFAEACDLGANCALGEYLIFLNSDVYPQRPHWARAMTQFLAANPQAGVVGCKMVYPNGEPQHCGAALRYNDRLDVWECVHLGDNLSDPSPKEVPYVTGACVAIRKNDFVGVNGFCTDYLIGNFEDLELCDAMRAWGKQVWYLSDVVMIHEWHKSFKAMGDDNWLDRLWLYNALLFMHRKKGLDHASKSGRDSHR